MKHKREVLICTLSILIIMAGYCWAGNTNNQNARQYRIVKSEDISIKALTKPLSAYSHSQLKALPMNIRKEYRIVVPSDISKEELKLSMKNLVKHVTTKNPDIDEIIVFAYAREEDADGAYTFGKMEWCPKGNWAGVTPYIASSNNRSSYKYIFDIKSKVGQLADINTPTKQEFAIYDTYYKQLWADLDVDEDIILERVAKNLGISEKKLQEIWLKVTAYNLN